MRVGLFGGSFDPPHRGHLAAAVAAADGFGLERVLLAPAAAQPLKPEGSDAPYGDRLAMVRLLCEHDPRLEASELDAPQADGAPNYTVDTVARLRAQLAPEDEVYVLLGADALAGLPRWRDPERLLELAEVIAISRPSLADTKATIEAVAPEAQRARVLHVLEGVDEPASATAIRERLERGAPVDDLLLPEVAAYIRSHGLYGAGAR